MYLANKGLVQMTNRRLAQIERRIEKIKAELARMGEMRPGSLTRLQPTSDHAGIAENSALTSK
jgi:hypothetical protein